MSEFEKLSVEVEFRAWFQTRLNRIDEARGATSVDGGPTYPIRKLVRVIFRNVLREVSCELWSALDNRYGISEWTAIAHQLSGWQV